jgi:UDP-glucose 4-epimerase
MKIIITGGAGFIGSNLVDAYIDAGHSVYVIDNLSSGSKTNINKKSKFYKVDIRSKKIDALFKEIKPDIVNHHAAQIDVRKSVADPLFDADTNVLGTINLLQISAKYGVKKFIFSSTGGAIYGEQETFPADENHPVNPVSPYGISKLCAEHYIKYFYIQYNLPYTCLRYSNVYGPRQNPHGEAGVVAIFIQRLLEGKPAIINGDGLQTRDFVYVKDVVKANLLATESPFIGVLNIGTGMETDIKTVYNLIASALKSKKEPIYGPAKRGEQKRSSISSNLARKELGWEFSYNVQQGLTETVAYFASNFKSK